MRVRASQSAAVKTSPKPAAPEKAVAEAPPKKSGWSAKSTTSVRAVSAPSSAVKRGPVGELEPMSAIVVANPDGFGPTQALHEALAKALPKSTKLVVLQAKDHSDAWSGPAPKGAIAVKTSTDSPWARDFAPTFVRTKEGKLEAVEFKYAYPGADSVAASMSKKLGVPVRSSPLVVEGGNLLTDQGKLFVTSKLLKTNPGMTKAQVETELKRALNIDDVVWMTPLPNEPTGHVDMYAKLIAPGTMLVSDTHLPAQKKVMDEAAKKFEALGYTVLRAKNAVNPKTAGDEQVRSYANSLVVNGTAFVPQYRSLVDDQAGIGKAVAKLDQAALDAYAKAGLTVVGVPANELINFQGSVHCMTNAVPAEVDVTKLGR